MRHAKARSVEKKRFWQGVLKEQSKSGLTVKAFCQQQGVSVPSFYAWRRKLMKRKSDAGGQEDGPPRMVPVTVLPPVPAAGEIGRVPIEIVTPAGLTLRVDRTLSPADVAELLRVVLACQSEASSC